MARRQSADVFERHFTPPWMTRALVLGWPDLVTASYWPVVEPCAGAGGIADVIEQEARAIHPDDRVVHRFDLAPSVRASLFGDDLVATEVADALDDAFWISLAGRGLRLATVVTNPPFSIGRAIWRKARAHRHPCAFLFRWSVCEETEDESRWYDADPPRDIIRLPRGSFTGGGTDMVAVGWWIWPTFDPIARDVGTRWTTVTHAEAAKLGRGK